jgi:hypothetical protein
VTDDGGVVARRKGAQQLLWTPVDKQACRESAEPHLTSSEVMIPIARVLLVSVDVALVKYYIPVFCLVDYAAAPS